MIWSKLSFISGLTWIPHSESIVVIFCTVTKIHKPTPVVRPIMWGCNGPKERISAFVDRLIQPIRQKQDSYLKDTTDFLNFIYSTKLPKNTVLVSMDVTSLYTNIPRRGRNTRMSRIQSPYTHQVPKRNAPPYINRNFVPNFAVACTYKPMEQPWEQRWTLILQISSWPE